MGRWMVFRGGFFFFVVVVVVVLFVCFLVRKHGLEMDVETLQNQLFVLLRCITDNAGKTDYKVRGRHCTTKIADRH